MEDLFGTPSSSDEHGNKFNFSFITSICYKIIDLSEISVREPPTEISDESMILGIIYRLVTIFGLVPSGQDFLAYFWFFALLEFGNLHVVGKGINET